MTKLSLTLAASAALVSAGLGDAVPLRPGPEPSAQPAPARGAASSGGAPHPALPPTAVAIWKTAPPLPRPVSNNAVTALRSPAGASVFSFLGIDETKRWDGLVSWAFRWDVGEDAWREIAPVPGPGRLAPTAEALGAKVYLFGGYTVAQNGSEKSLPNVDIYDPETDTWSRGADMPVPVDDAVSGVWRDSLILLVSGWHDTGNVTDVQIYDPSTDRWRAGTPIPDTPVFGHAGGVAGNAIVYLGGARVTDGQPRYHIEDSAWYGAIDPADPTQIAWTRLDDPPGPPVYRAAAVGVGRWVIFAGGTDNPYNYDGLGYDGAPSEPLDEVFLFDAIDGVWRTLAPLAIPTMDHRAIAFTGDELVLAGGMEAGQRVTRRTTIADGRELLTAR